MVWPTPAFEWHRPAGGEVDDLLDEVCGPGHRDGGIQKAVRHVAWLEIWAMKDGSAQSIPNMYIYKYK